MAPNNRVAIVAMHVKLPAKINTCDQLWQLLMAGRDVFERGPIIGRTVTLTSHIPDASWFAPDHFGISGFEADLMDPQHRLLLEMSWECLSSMIDHDDERITGVFASCGPSSYFQDVLIGRPELWERSGDQLITGNHPDTLATRIAYCLGLRGPALYVGTGCSSALVAVNQAIQAINSFQCDQALVAAARIRSPREKGYEARQGGIYSSDGICRPFSDSANGTVPGSGAAVILVKRLDDALADGDYIYAVIEGSAVNNDGRIKAGFTAPSVEGQLDCISTALDASHVEPSEVCYIEAHGTGTNVGDPIELRALSMAYGTLGPGKERYLGAIKANIGHCDAASGLFALIKAAMVLDKGIVPPQINIGIPTTKHDWSDRALYVAQEMVELAECGWPGGCRAAGVTSLGVGGTNAHVLLRDARQLIKVNAPVAPPINRIIGRKEHGIEFSTPRQTGSDTQLANPSDAPVVAEVTDQMLLELFSLHTINPVADVHHNFFDRGGDSLGLIYLVEELSALSGREISIELLAETPTAEFAKKLLLTGRSEAGRPASGAAAPGADLAAVRADIAARLAARALPEPSNPTASAAPDAVLLTGASGFVGVFVLAELLSRGGKVICLLRDGHSRRSALIERLANFGLWHPEYDTTLSIADGDIARPKLGLEISAYGELSSGVAQIIHCAARVNHIFPYEQLADVNTHSAADLLHLAGNGCPKRLTFVSTAAVFGTPSYVGAAEVDSAPLTSIPPESQGYGRSKAIAELYLEQAGNYNVPAVIVRIPNIFGDRIRYHINEKDAIWNWTRAIITTSCYPASFDIHGNELFQALPGDVAASVITDAGLSQDEPGCRIINAIPNLACTSRALIGGLREAGHCLRPLPDPEWYSLVAGLDVRDTWVAAIAAERATSATGAPQRLQRCDLDEDPDISHLVNTQAIWAPRDLLGYIRSLTGYRGASPRHR